MIQPHFFYVTGFCTLLWCGVYLAFAWIVDPYGVSPVSVSRERINRYKPARIDIDRSIKPYEVWRYQPRTVFLGTSRIHQSIDPVVLDGTPYAPAYNAAIPASTLSLNAAHLDQYFVLDPNLKFVFVELFIYNFINGQAQEPRKHLTAFAADSAALHWSQNAVWDSIRTIQFNRSGAQIGPYVHPRGYWVRPAGFDTAANFDIQAYSTSIMRVHQQIPRMELQPSAFEALDRIVQICRENGATLALIIAPSHPYDDYRLWSLGYWEFLEHWYRTVARYPNVLDFSQYNSALEEPISKHMKYWSDPLHFSLGMGKAMLENLLDRRDPGMPDNMMTPVSQENVEKVLEARRRGLQHWIVKNRQFTAVFDKVNSVTDGDPGHGRYK